MVKRRTRAEIREEFTKLLEVFIFLQSQQIEDARESGDSRYLEILEKNQANKKVTLADFDAERRWSHPDYPHQPDEPKWAASQHLQGLREALNDMLLGIREAIGDEAITGPTRWSRTPETYHRLTGSDLFLDGGDPIGRIKAILKRGTVKNEEEWRLLNEVVTNVDANLLNVRQSEKAEKLMFEFERHLTT